MKALWVALLTAAGSAGAGGEPGRPVAVVELAVFDCPHCLEARREHPGLQRAAERAGIRFVFAPVDAAGDGMRERLYYAAREMGGLDEQVADAFYLAQELSVPTSSASHAIAWLEQQVPGVMWRRFAGEALPHTDAEAALERARKLARKAGARQVPAYVLVYDTGRTELITDTGSAPERIEKVYERIRQR